MSSSTAEFPGVAGDPPVAPAPQAAAPGATRASRGRASAFGALLAPETVLTGLALLVLLAISAHLRLRALNAHFWIDEGLSVGIATHHLSAIPGVLRQDGSPPAYYLLLHFWIQAFGSSERSVHELSVAFALLGVPATYWALSKPFGRWAALIGAMLAAVNPFLGEYADEGRMYSMLYLESVLAIGVFFRAFILGQRRWVPGFSLVLALLIYTHNWGFFLAASLGAGFLLLLLLDYSRRLLLDGVLAFGGAALLFAPWVPTLLSQVAHTGAPWSHPPNRNSLDNVVTHMMGGTSPEALLAAIAAVGAFRLRRVANRRAMLIAAGAAGGTLLLGWAYSRYGTPAWALRYLTIVLAPLIVLLGAGIAQTRWLGAVLTAAVLVLAWYGTPSIHTLSSKSNVASVARHMRPRLPLGATVVSMQPEQVPVLNYYLHRRDLRYYTPLGRFRDVGVMDWRDAYARLKRARFERVLAPLVARLRPGQRLLMVDPRFGHTSAKWTKLIRVLTLGWGGALRSDRRLHLIYAIKASHGYNRSTVNALLFVKRA